MTTLTDDERNAAMAICDQVNKLKEGLCERDWPRFAHKKTGKIVKFQGVDKSFYAPSILVVAVAKENGARHVRTSPVGALNFQRDYELVALETTAALTSSATPATPAPADAAGDTGLADLLGEWRATPTPAPATGAPGAAGDALDATYVPTWEREGATAPGRFEACEEIISALYLTNRQALLAHRLIGSVLRKEEERTEYWKGQHEYCVGKIRSLEKQPAAPAAPAAPEAGPGGAGAWVQLLPAENGPGAALFGDYLYVLLPDGKVTQAMYCDFFTDEIEGEAWGFYSDIDVIDPLPVQPTHYFTPPTHR